MQSQSFLFDLDGTITDSKRGIINSVQYALERFDIHDVDQDILSSFLGPPLWESFPKYFSFSQSDTEKAVELYREYFKEKGIYENEVYEGIPAMLSELHAKGHTLYIATAKPEYYAGKIIHHFDLLHLFNDVCGASMDISRSTKPAIIGYVIEKHGVVPQDSWMIGDKHHDIHGGKYHKMKTIAVGYGYGSQQELYESNPDHFCNTVSDLHTLLSSITAE